MVRVQEQRYEQLDRLTWGSGTLQPAQPDRWQMRVASFQADGVRVELIRARAMRFTSAEPRDAGGPVVLAAVAAGRLHGIGPDAPFDVLPGRALLADSSLPATVWAEDEVQVLRVAVDRSEVPAHLLARPPMPLTVLDPSPVLRASVAYASTLLQSSREECREDDGTVARTMIALQLGLLEESRRQRTETTGENDRRARIEAHIDAHLADPELTPTSIAHEFGLSLRSVHAAFSGSDGTLAATIRLRRIEAVQRMLLADGPLPRTSDLAAAHGFRDRSHLARSFRDVTGTSLREWWAEARRR